MKEEDGGGCCRKHKFRAGEGSFSKGAIIFHGEEIYGTVVLALLRGRRVCSHKFQ